MMAVLTGTADGSMADMSCGAAHNSFPLTGMGAMYALMAVFHSAPWLKLVARRGSGARRP